MNINRTIFENGPLGMDLSVVELEGKDWFIGTEVAKMLGYKKPSNAVLQIVKPQYKKTIHVDKMKTVNFGDLGSSLLEGGPLDITIPSGVGISIKEEKMNRSYTLISEAGVYQLVFGSRLAAAESFRSWVFEEVLPSIRKHGKYDPVQDLAKYKGLTEEEVRKLLVNQTELISEFLKLTKDLNFVIGQKLEHEEEINSLNKLVETKDEELKEAHAKIRKLVDEIVIVHCEAYNREPITNVHKKLKLVYSLLMSHNSEFISLIGSFPEYN